MTVEQLQKLQELADAYDLDHGWDAEWRYISALMDHGPDLLAEIRRLRAENESLAAGRATEGYEYVSVAVRQQLLVVCDENDALRAEIQRLRAEKDATP